MRKSSTLLKLFKSIVMLCSIFMLVGSAKTAYANDLHYLQPYYYGSESKVYTGDTTKSFTMMGNTYHYGVAADGLYVDRDFLFNLDGKFSKVTFDLGNVDYSGGLRGNKGNAYFYLDGTLVDSVAVSPGMITQKISLNTTGKQQLKVDFVCDDNTNYDAYYGLGNVVGYGGHFYTVENTIPATVTTDGLRTYTCSVCNHSYTETVEKTDKCIPYLHPYQTSDNMTIYKGGDSSFTAMGIKYNYGVAVRHWNNNRVVYYNLGQKYNSISFEVGWTGAGTNYTRAATMKIYGDNVLMKTVSLDYMMPDQMITLQTAGITQLKIEMGEANSHYGLFNMSYVAKEAKTHNFTSEVTLEPTETMTGIETYTCGDCGVAYTEIIPALGKGEINCKLSSSKLVYTGKQRTPKIQVTDKNGNVLEENKDYELEYSSDKRVEVGRYQVKVVPKNGYEGGKTYKFTIVPKKVSTLTSELYQYGNKVRLTWAKSEGATGYRIEWKQPGSSSYKFLTNTKNLYYTKSGLKTNKSYSFKVIPYYEKDGTKYYSTSSSAYRTTSIKTVKKGSKIAQVGKPTVTKSGTKIKVKWKNIKNETGYQISRSTSKTGTSIVSTFKTTTGKSKIITATKGQTYYYKIRAYKTVNGKKIYGEWSTTVKFKR